MAKENISVKFLIHLIGERPALWDKTSEEYKDRSLKETSWREICTFINENYERMTPKAKEEFTRLIMKKWTHIRDSWVKSMKYGYDEKTKKPPKPYIYHNELQFMQKILKCKRRPYDFAMSYLSNDEVYGYRTETQISNNDLSYCENNGEDSAGKDNSRETNEQIKEEEIHTKTEPIQDLENANGRYNNTTDDEDWPLNEVDITPAIELNKVASESKAHKTNATVKKTRSSIFIKAGGSNETEQEVSPPLPPISVPQFETSIATAPQATACAVSFNAYKYLNDNRHWNFFKGILPSVNSLDEDNTLQFQSGVIALLQQLRESQRNQTMTKAGKIHSLYRGRGRKRKPSADVDYERPSNKTNISKRRRATRSNADPIAAEDRQTESEYSTD